MKSRNEMIQYIANELVANIDIKKYLRHKHYRYVDEMSHWSDDKLTSEYNKLQW